MKRILWVAIALMFYASTSFAAGSCIRTNTAQPGVKDRKIIELTCTGDGTIAAYTVNPAEFNMVGWYLYSVTTDPGTSAPTADYDITLMVNGEDITGSLLLNRSASATQTVIIAPSTLGYHLAKDPIVITFANETANPSTIVLTLRFIAN